MISISCNTEEGLLNIKVSGGNFQDTIEALKDTNCVWNPKTKYWNKSITELESLKKGLEYVLAEPIEVSELVWKQYRDYLNSIKELEVAPSRRIPNWGLLNYPPLKGIPPNEDYQSQDCKRALNQNRFLFNWEMGLGKSAALTFLIENLRYYKLINKCLIFSTGVGVFNLKDELCKFGKNIRPEQIFVVNSVTEIKDRDLFNSNKYPYDILIMTYDTFKNISNYYYDRDYGTKTNPKPSVKTKYKKSCVPLLEWMGGEDAALFLDECHSLSNPKARRSECLNMCLDRFKYRYEFTGTLADKYEKLYEPYLILDKSLVGAKSYNDWLADYNNLGTRFSRYAVNPNGWKMDKLGELDKKVLTTYASKRLMRECLNLPMNYDVPTIQLEMSPLQREIYESFVKEQLRVSRERNKENGTKKESIINMFQIFQLAVDNPECIVNSPTFELFSEELQNKIRSYKYERDSTKLVALKTILEENIKENGERAIVWYYHPKTKDVLEKELKEYDPIIVDAGIGNEEMNRRVKEFKTNDKHKIIIGSINIMNTSVTITEASFSVYVERTYNYTIWSQSKGRNFRPGQTKITRQYTMSYRKSIDNLQLENLKQKGELIAGLLNKDYIEQNIWKSIFNYELNQSLY